MKNYRCIKILNNSSGITRSFMVFQKCFVSFHCFSVPPYCECDACAVCVCLYWPSCPLSWLLIKRLVYAEKHSGGVCFDLLPIPSLYSFIARSPLSCLSLALSLQPPVCSADFARWELTLKCQTAEGVISCSDMKTLGALGFECGLKRRRGAFHHVPSPGGNKEITVTQMNGRPNLHLFPPCRSSCDGSR